MTSRRSFVALSTLVGVGLSVLAGCDLPGTSKGKGRVGFTNGLLSHGRRISPQPAAVPRPVAPSGRNSTPTSWATR
ncbi:Tat pathway signal sequence domain protein [Actinomyces sp. oral taxon 171 str. F0337]|nr:Tat pathway signal sequence domain protein [Actinomyces sp. oral taxon 171 str. F0337]